MIEKCKLTIVKKEENILKNNEHFVMQFSQPKSPCASCVFQEFTYLTRSATECATNYAFGVSKRLVCFIY